MSEGCTVTFDDSDFKNDEAHPCIVHGQMLFPRSRTIVERVCKCMRRLTRGWTVGKDTCIHEHFHSRTPCAASFPCAAETIEEWWHHARISCSRVWLWLWFYEIEIEEEPVAMQVTSHHLFHFDLVTIAVVQYAIAWFPVPIIQS